MIVDHCLFAMIIAGIGLAVTDPKAALRELHANRLQPKQIDLAAAALRNHQPFLSKASALCAPAEWLFTVYSRESAEVGIARHRELA
jgi:hypothetical protein